MISASEDFFICDMAEFYHIYNYKEYSPDYVAVLAKGLDNRSRIVRFMSDTKASTEQILLALCSDSLSFLAWSKTDDALHNRNRPKMLAPTLLGVDKKEENNVKGFADGQSFMEAWNN